MSFAHKPSPSFFFIHCHHFHHTRRVCMTPRTTTVETVKQLEEKLTTFAKTHHKAIATDPAFRQKFLSMCAPLGVDPLTSKKSFWSFLNMGDFYHELAVKVAEVCYAYRSKNGGIMSIKEVQGVLVSRGTKFRLNKVVSKYNEEDIIVAIEKLKQLGSGFRTVKVGNSVMVVSVPTELDNDHVHVIQVAQDVAQGITVEMVEGITGWDRDRVKRALDLLLAEGMAWIDHYNGEELYWFPSVWKDAMAPDEM
jgi:ESCRT-II complex subunit VPS22